MAPLRELGAVFFDFVFLWGSFVLFWASQRFQRSNTFKEKLGDGSSRRKPPCKKTHAPKTFVGKRRTEKSNLLIKRVDRRKSYLWKALHGMRPRVDATFFLCSSSHERIKCSENVLASNQTRTQETQQQQERDQSSSRTQQF